MIFLTDFADEAVVLPLIFAVAATLFLLGWRRGAGAWIIAAGVTLGAMLVLKLIGIACGPIHLRTPSGHTAAAAVVAGGLAAILARRLRCLAAFGAATLAAGVIGASRLALGVHSWAEVLLAAAVGIGGAVGFAWLAGAPPHRLRLRWMALAVVAVLLAFHGRRMPAEAHIRAVALQLAQDLGVCRGAAGWAR